MAEAANSRSLTEQAPAKINLYLHVTGKRDDGYHLLDSLAVFPDIGDRITASPADGLMLSCDGPFADGLDTGDDNLVMKAARALRSRFGVETGASLHLEKNLPVASGIGGGSADAAATLRVLARLWDLLPTPGDLHRIALSLGADVPVCLTPEPAFMSGIGEKLAPVDGALPRLGILLANPGVAVETPPVFKARQGPFDYPAPFQPKSDAGAFIDQLQIRQNALQAPATEIAPEIGAVLRAIEATDDVQLARMSGSGATCFGLYADRDRADTAAAALKNRQPDWWVQSGRLGA